MQPVARGHTADADVPAAQDFLPDKRNHDGVINIVICGVAARDILKSKLGNKADHAGIAGLQCSVCPFVHRLKFTDEGFYNYQGGVEHGSQPHCAQEGSPMIQSLSHRWPVSVRRSNVSLRFAVLFWPRRSTKGLLSGVKRT